VQSNNINAFFELVRAGLWEKDARLSQFGNIDFNEVYRLAEEQSVVGLVAAGLEHVDDFKLPKEEVLQFVGQALQLEQQNQAMNVFIGKLIEKMHAKGIYAILVKGQGVAQCYERPLWRACGDVDFFLSEDNYKKAIKFLEPMSSSCDQELSGEKHVGMTIDSWVVELHGDLPSRISPRADKVLKRVQDSVFYGGSISYWRDGKTDVFLLHPNENVIFVFTHILKHFFREGIGLRQICDWCRLLWTSRKELDIVLLKERLEEMGFLPEWNAFAAFAVEYLGMPLESMPLYKKTEMSGRKAKCILDYILKVGNFGHNRDGSFRVKKSFLTRKWKAFKYKLEDFHSHSRIFPVTSLRVFLMKLKSGIVSTIKHEG